MGTQKPIQMALCKRKTSPQKNKSDDQGSMFEIQRRQTKGMVIMEMKTLRSIVIDQLCAATTRPREQFDVSDQTAMAELAIDSMALFSVLLSIENCLEKGDISQLMPDTPPPKTFGDLLQLAAKIGKLHHLTKEQ